MGASTNRYLCSADHPARWKHTAGGYTPALCWLALRLIQSIHAARNGITFAPAASASTRSAKC